MNHSNFIDNIFNATQNAPSTDELSDTFIKEKRLIKPQMPHVPYGCPSLFDLKHHLFVIKEDRQTISDETFCIGKNAIAI